MKNALDYYDIDFDKASSLDDIFSIKDLKQRKLYLSGTIETYYVELITKHILQYNREDFGIEPDKRRPILLYITTDGGSLQAGFELIDVIQNSKTPVYTINLGTWYSMGLLIGIAGHKRYATKNASFLLHDGEVSVYNSGCKVIDAIAFHEKTVHRIGRYVSHNSNLNETEYVDMCRKELYMYSEDAKAKGFIDYIIGEDCDIDAII